MGRIASRAGDLGLAGTPRLGDVANPDATVKVCDVVVAMVQRRSWVPIPSKVCG
jgi:hypothetical protein